jgi:hypothetical protein
MRLASVCLLLTGCGLSSSDSPAPDLYTRDCIQTMDRGSTLPNGPIALVLTSACGDSSMVDNVQFYESTLQSLTSHTAFGAKYRATRIANLDTASGVETLGILDDAPGYVEWRGFIMAQPTRVDYARPFDDLAVGDLDHDLKPDVIVAGDDALRIALGTGSPPSAVTPTDERTLLTGKAFKNLAVSPKGELYYLAQSAGMVELGIARASATDPLVFTATALATDAAGPRALVLADIDGDGISDAIGAASRVFVTSSRSGTVSFLDEGALAVSTGDTDADGVDEPIFLAADGASVRRVLIAADGSLTAEHVLEVHAQTLTVGDFDGNGIDDIAVLDRIGRTGSTVSLYRN